MNIETTKDRFIRILKLIGSGGLFCLMILILALMFCEYQKVAALLFSEDMIGVLGLVTGLFVGFAIGVFVTYQIYENEKNHEKYLQHIFEKAYTKNEPKPCKKRQPKAPTAPARPVSSKTPQTKASQPTTPKSQAPVQQTPSANAPDNSEDSRAKHIFGILDEFEDLQEFPVDEVLAGEDVSEDEVLGNKDAPEAEMLEAPEDQEAVVDNNTLQDPLPGATSSEESPIEEP